MNSTEPTSSDLGLQAITTWKIAGAIVALLGLPLAGGVIAMLGEGGTAALQSANDWRARRDHRRLRALLKAFERRLEAVEAATQQTPLSEEHVDLAYEVLEKAGKDDELRKAPIYAGLFEWIVSERPNRTTVCLLKDGVAALTYAELWILIAEVGTHLENQDLRRILEQGERMTQNTYYQRVEAWGLGSNSVVKMRGQATPYASVLVKYTTLNELEPPNQIADSVLRKAGLI